MQTKPQTTKGQGTPELPTQFPNGTKVLDIYTGEINTVKCSYWQAYDGQGDYTVEFEPTEAQPTGWNKSTNLRAVAPNIEDGATLGALIEKHKPQAQHSPLLNCPKCGTHWTKHLWATFDECDHKRVFIPDNSGGGTWETWKDDRPTAKDYKASAEKLAEALREVKSNASITGEFPSVVIRRSTFNKAIAALAQWEEASQ